jgi:hypothetical protein
MTRWREWGFRINGHIWPRRVFALPISAALQTLAADLKHPPYLFAAIFLVAAALLPDGP